MAEEQAKLFAVRTTIGQERGVADMLTARVEKEKLSVYSVLVPHDIRGYIVVEAVNKTEIDKAIKGVSHARGVVVGGEVAFGDIEKFFESKPVAAKVSAGDVVEVISGPFKGERARVVRADEKKEEITIELFEAMVPIPVTVKGDSLKLVQREEKEEKKKEKGKEEEE